jgi:hypothetical protein
MNRTAINALLLAVGIVFIVTGAVNSHTGGGVTLLLLGLILSSWATYRSVTAKTDERHRKSLEARIGDGTEAPSEITDSPEPVARPSGLGAEDLRLKEYKTKRDAAEYELRPYLPANPRGAKRLINHERLYAQIAEDRGIFGGSPELTYRHLAKWVLIVEHWPRLAAALTREPGKIEALERLAPILGRLVRFEPAVTTSRQAPASMPAADEVAIPDASGGQAAAP